VPPHLVRFAVPTLFFETVREIEKRVLDDQ